MIDLTIPVRYMWRDGFKIRLQEANQLSRYLAQPFGVNWAAFSYKDVFGVNNHDGIDIALPTGEPIFASHWGKVINVDNEDDRDGLGVVLRDSSGLFYTIYWHNSKNLVSIGDEVKRGQLIALSGGTGKAYGPHLHFGLYPLAKDGKIEDYNNGYKGAVDPIGKFSNIPPHFNYMSREFITNFYLTYFGRKPNDQETESWYLKDYRDLMAAALRERSGLFESAKV